jgi:translocation and assembly module TamA
MVGPVDSAGNPLGGQSLLEASAELRIRISDEVGLVPFIDGGNVYATTLPQFDQMLRFGTGLGIRYFTDFGPLRLDIGVPLQAHKSDDPVQVYLSLGQAF